MKSPREIVFLISVILCVDVTNGELGAACYSLTDCTTDADCIHGICNCTEIWYIGNSLTPICRSWQYEKLCTKDEECWENAKCISVKCECNEGFYRINSSCRKVKLQGVMKQCKINLNGADTEMCDINKHSICIENTCVCTKGYIPNKYGQCESKESYLTRTRMTEYRVTPGEYCREDTDCIEGLECKSFECTCPSGCKHVARNMACDCGDVETEVAPIIVGVLLGVINISFWFWAIRRTIVKHKEKMKRLSYHTAINDDVSASHPLSPVQSSDQTVAGFVSPSSRTAGTPIREDRGTSRPYSINPPTAPNNPVNLASDNPPSYEEVISSPLYKPKPSSLQNAPDPPPYIPLSSGTWHSSSPSHSPTAPPYSISPQATLQSGSLDAIPNPGNPSTPAVSLSSPLHSSVPEIQQAYNPHFYDGNVSGSAASDGPSRL